MLFKIGSSPLKFTLCECIEKDEVKNLIEANGGIFLNKYEKGVILLLPYDINYVVKNYSEYEPISYKFIYDSVALKNLQPIQNYSLSVAKTYKSNYAIRAPYTDQEDNDISKYVLTHFGNPKIISFWNNYKKETGSERTVDSLRAHWKVLIKRYAYNPSANKSEKCNKNDLKLKKPKPLSVVKEYQKNQHNKSLEINSCYNETILPNNMLKIKRLSNDTDKINQKNWVNNVKKEEDTDLYIKKDQRFDKIIEENSRTYGFTDLKINYDDNVPIQIVLKDDPDIKTTTNNILGKEPLKSLENTMIKSKKRNDKEMGENRIEELFENLVEICKIKTNSHVSPNEIAKVLISFKGNVKSTIDFFCFK
ncbi:hypothetical protein SteCoe_28295 [Stentor coeruleus]|uniref:BRCT domain-containing protein n=1 Tax=Stentor coeruleus TaxID=5963 RepID=A0A1R2B8H7_9CILI|nr:hypothetical protein SteCoe_28295 [Stentor coeruleus]